MVGMWLEPPHSPKRFKLKNSRLSFVGIIHISFLICKNFNVLIVKTKKFKAKRTTLNVCVQEGLERKKGVFTLRPLSSNLMHV